MDFHLHRLMSVSILLVLFGIECSYALSRSSDEVSVSITENTTNHTEIENVGTKKILSRRKRYVHLEVFYLLVCI